ncbi:MAG: SUMF1/EgtB/PvdO family nonheme iron enzyme [Saprospiraceae bacterium]|nr:SUMF1/EgtB/PvdO family nonheme iron enzyme [Saprospiraceae bacterium]
MRYVAVFLLATLALSCSRQIIPVIDVANANKKQTYYIPKSKAFVYVPSGSLRMPAKSNGLQRSISVQGFFLLNHEVTVGEYQLFLESLLKENKQSEFDIARIYPDTLGVLPADYFTSPAYKNHPVVCVSGEGAVLFCKWLSERAKVDAGKADTSRIHFRLPTSHEWVYAAMGGYDTLSYSSRVTYNLKNSKLLNFRDIEPPSIQPSIFYFPNNYGLYNMSGNAAEMVISWRPNANNDKFRTLFGSIGGSWNSTSEEVKISAPDPYVKMPAPSPYIGFRPLCNFLGWAINDY